MLHRVFRVSILPLVIAASLRAQVPSAVIETRYVPADEVIDKALTANVLTHNGKPFHAVMDIREAKSDPAFAARVELFWSSEQKYRLVIQSHDFDQTLIVNDSSIEEQDRGDFYPVWLHSFVLALMDPMPLAANIEGHNAMVDIVQGTTSACVKRDDRPNGITDQLTFVDICFKRDDLRIDFVREFAYFMIFSDYSPSQGKQIARKYNSSTGFNTNLEGALSTLEPLPSADDKLFTVTQPTAPEKRIATKLVSTATEESMLERKPDDTIWPSVREGKLDGFMIVNATTDRTGQVREARRHDSDNPELEGFGNLVALKYKFKPLVINGVPQQMEMPLVLHFTTKTDNPIPELDDKSSRKLISGCEVPRTIQAPSLAGKPVTITLSVNETGHFTAIHNINPPLPVFPFFKLFSSCRYDVYKQNGKPTPYYARIVMTGN